MQGVILTVQLTVLCNDVAYVAGAMGMSDEGHRTVAVGETLS